MNMKISDFGSHRFDGDTGLCASCTDDRGNELILSQCFIDGVDGVRVAVDMFMKASSADDMTRIRYGMIGTMVKHEATMPDMLVTSKGNGAIATIKREWRIERNLPRHKVPVVMSLIASLAQLQGEYNETLA